jgi:hypothetical protein
VKRAIAVFAFIVLSMIMLLPAVLNTNTVSAQSSGYTIQSVDHQIEIMFSGHTVVRDTIKVSGDLSKGFLIGMPGKFGVSVLKAIAYDDTHVYPMDLGVQLGSQSGFYAAQVNFEGATPQTFTVVFVLSNSLIGQDFGFFQLEYPAYPSFTTSAGTCSVTVSPPSQVSTITISKSDGEVNSTSYSKNNLPAFTNIPALAAFAAPVEILQSFDISSLNRKLTIDVAGTLSCSDNYRITNTAKTNSMSSFLLSLPSRANKVVVKDEFGRVATSEISGTVGYTLIVNASITPILSAGQSTMLTADYNLPTGSSIYNLNITLFPAFNYFVDQATFTFTPPEGARITSPQNSSLDSSSSLTRDTYQDVLTINRQGVSYVDSTIPSVDTLIVNYDYSPVWSSFRPTFWALTLSVIGCIGIIFWRKRQPSEKAPAKTEAEKQVAEKAPAPQAEAKNAVPKSSLRVTADTVGNFTEDYDERREISSEMKSLDERAQKGKIPRRQYKVQRRSLEVRFDSLTRNINEMKEVFQNSGSGYADLIKQLDSTEADWTEADENIKNLDAKKNSGEISIEEYKKNIGDNKRRKEKADSSISGILLRLREKMR